MDVIYKCGCMTREETINVPDRRPATDILVWMEMVQNCIGFDHRQLSPLCQSLQTEYVKISMEPGAAGLGVRPTKN